MIIAHPARCPLSSLELLLCGIRQAQTPLQAPDSPFEEVLFDAQRRIATQPAPEIGGTLDPWQCLSGPPLGAPPRQSTWWSDQLGQHSPAPRCRPELSPNPKQHLLRLTVQMSSLSSLSLPTESRLHAACMQKQLSVVSMPEQFNVRK